MYSSQWRSQVQYCLTEFRHSQRLADICRSRYTDIISPYISRHFSSSATFYFGPFQPLRTSDALSRCNVAVRLRARAASTSIFASFFCPFEDARHVQRNPSLAMLQPNASHAFSLSTSRDRIRCQSVMSDRSRRCRIKHTQKLSHTFVLDTPRYKILFIQFARNVLRFYIMQCKNILQTDILSKDSRS